MSSREILYIIDPDTSIAETISSLLGVDRQNIQSFISVESFFQRFNSDCPLGCLLIDVTAHKRSIFKLFERLRNEHVYLPVIVLTSNADISFAVEVMQAGAAGLVEKPIQPEPLLKNIETALRKIEHQESHWRLVEQIEKRMGRLSSGEYAVMEKMILGKLNKHIASELDIGLRTVELRRANVLKKMQTESLAELIRLAMVADKMPNDLTSDT